MNFKWWNKFSLRL